MSNPSIPEDLKDRRNTKESFFKGVLFALPVALVLWGIVLLILLKGQ